MDRITNDIVCVILAGGRGTRMASAQRHKVCFQVAGRPAIVRAIDAYKEAGIHRFLVVVGQMAEQVIETVSSYHPEVTFVHQPEPRGTGHAATVAAEALAAQGFSGATMLTMGDKIVQPHVVRNLIRSFSSDGADVVVSALPKSSDSTAGRLVQNGDGSVLGILELPDIQKARDKRAMLELGKRAFTAEEAEAKSDSVNASLYLYEFGKLQEALRHLSPSNAQGELYLTDTVAYIAEHGSVATLNVPDPTNLMTFNTPDELLQVEQTVRERESAPLRTVRPEQVLDARTLKPARDWLIDFESLGGTLKQTLQSLYGNDPAVLEERRQAFLELIRAFIGHHGLCRPMILCRAPGRINLMGRHVDHRGGHVNVMAVNREVLLAAAPREDDVVRLHNVEVSQFPNREFRISGLLREESWSDWMDFLESSTVHHVLKSAPGDWSHYARAPLLRLQYHYSDTRLKGMDCMVSGNIPMGAGLSSSSALVVAFAAAAVALNNLDVSTRDFVDLCGEGEWFVGSRGGSADHAAIRTSELGHISRIGFFPFQVENGLCFPSDLNFVIANSGTKAVKSAGARDVFNQRVACYEFAEILLRNSWSAAAGMEHLRDLTPANLGVRAADLYQALMKLPYQPRREDLRRLVPVSEQDRIERIFSTHIDLGTYDLRGAALFGISECIRSSSFGQALAERDFARISQLMRASHDGDRCSKSDEKGNVHSFIVSLDDLTLKLLADCNADLSLQSGRYACSTEAIDQMVDISNATEGVIGAQLAGAGLGGCMMILLHNEALEDLRWNLNTKYYAVRDLESSIYVCTPVAGAGLLSL